MDVELITKIVGIELVATAAGMLAAIIICIVAGKANKIHLVKLAFVSLVAWPLFVTMFVVYLLVFIVFFLASVLESYAKTADTDNHGESSD